jgi:PIN domain nuclease of toxin-antitoxin system
VKRLLLDTHIFLWAITADARLSKESRQLFESAEHELLISVGSLWEMLVKKQLGKLPVPSPAAPYLRKQLQQNRIAILNLAAEHVYQLEDLPPLHRDPFDRMLVAQALAEGIPLVTQDAQVRQYAVDCLG